ncbi:DUF3365 domain-containing protein [Thermosulfurimonas marina]|uniref:histidine kinase n=1 Tax=Thermosulfurimonas marina TaxID=2047767 RepID=A0A6H1WR86_9BACT|nr:ATP-binding protein [Thermosulfurimonas marina]QJA05678.1 DUF3365 domain-containing protein [Thermosulfurimonas marina]
MGFPDLPCRGLACRIILGSLLALLIPFLGFMVFVHYDDQRWMERELRSQARAIYHFVTTTRQWIAWHGGIYIQDEEGRYRLVTPSHFVKDLLTFSKDKLPYHIKVAVKSPKNPAHAPDAFEKEALQALAQGKREYARLEEGLYRYAAPLTFKPECRSCHRELEVPSMAGCISLSLKTTSIEGYLKKRKRLLTLFFGLMFGAVALSLSFLLRKTVLVPLSKFKEATQRIWEGHFARVHLGSRDEWQALAQAFNAMSERLENHQKELEEQVAQATRELKEAYEKLKETDRFKSEFFSHISHDLKTPLSAIKGTLDFLLRQDPENAHLRIAEKNVHKLLRMIEGILDLTRLEHGQIEFQKTLVDLGSLVEEVSLAHQPLAWEKSLDFQWALPEHPLWVEADPDFLYRALANLLDNALKFSPEGSQVRVRVLSENGWAQVEIEDSGPGVEEAEKNQIFHKFYHKNSGGLGLGLAISYNVIQAHGGEIEVRKARVLPGSLFVVRLKLAHGN